MRSKRGVRGAYCDDETTKATIQEVFEGAGYLCDTHTAVAVNAYQQYVAKTGDKVTPTVVVSTASPYKFADSVLSAVSNLDHSGMSEFEKVEELARETKTEIPAPIAGLEQKQVRFQNRCKKENMSDVLLQMVHLK